ncbi:hypothetical protein NDU88_006869 [Pleurodeles waltl]|uniref:Uncharacterized protein n=1 Tax=Pleurodeles waltl TaxID=8319 RepID=A0AAV7N2M2_PLEWA|nr:hypothetical protein NDU88_006869 [Pleurodeles waltl]
MGSFLSRQQRNPAYKPSLQNRTKSKVEEKNKKISIKQQETLNPAYKTSLRNRTKREVGKKNKKISIKQQETSSLCVSPIFLQPQCQCHKKNEAALVIQSWWRRAHFHRRERRRVWELSQYILYEKAAVLLQSFCRMWLARSRFRRCQRAARTIQTRWRAFTCQRQAVPRSSRGTLDLNIEIVVG